MAVSVPTGAIPDKLFYRIQEVAKIAGVKPHVLRYWETEFPQLSPRKDMNDQRRYTKADITLVLRVKKLLYEERYTIAGAKRRLRQETARDALPGGIDPKNLRALRSDVSDLLSLLDKRAPTAV
jgi:DNA-binding transcriptional MerR regulator